MGRSKSLTPAEIVPKCYQLDDCSQKQVIYLPLFPNPGVQNVLGPPPNKHPECFCVHPRRIRDAAGVEICIRHQGRAFQPRYHRRQIRGRRDHDPSPTKRCETGHARSARGVTSTDGDRAPPVPSPGSHGSISLPRDVRASRHRKTI